MRLGTCDHDRPLLQQHPSCQMSLEHAKGTTGCRLRCAWRWMQGLLQLHSHRPAILHRDLKSPNLLVDKHWRVKVTQIIQ